MFRCLVACGTEPTPGARAQEAALLVSHGYLGRFGMSAKLVPDQETLELLGELGVDLAQGFHIGRPRPVEELR